MTKRLVLLPLLAVAGALPFGHGAYLFAKAQLAQVLLERAWARTIRGERDVKPWSWADTWPVARIEFPRQRQSYIVLAGASGRTMAFGPGHVDGTAMPNESGNCAISAHRDSQFAVLRELHTGDAIVVETRDGRAIHYRVVSHHVISMFDTSPLEPSRGRILTLITCYPFDAIRPGGPLRYIVVARAV
ncbi:MAG TPA: class GN sortase [Thermoanaerobaculia bacterium]|nr:class GN sortase [Thermoanaerobaculia bacterium]